MTRPGPKEFAVEKFLDAAYAFNNADMERLIDRLKREMAHELAQFITTHCQLFEVPGYRDLRKGKPLRLQLTINDRGSYENWLPAEHERGRREGLRQARSAIPYGLDDAYE